MTESTTSLAHQNVSRLTVEDVLDSVCAPQGSSGAGVAVSLVLALGIACARKAVGVTLKHGDSAELQSFEERLQVLQHRAVAHAQRDALLFEAYLAAKRPLEAQHLVESGHQFQQLIADVGRELEALRGRVTDAVAGDVTAAQTFHRAAAQIAADLLRDARGERSRTVS